ncbi:MAG: signal peptidase I [Pseudomonadota bacterium]
MALANKKETTSGGIGETVSVIIQALVLALIIRTLLFQPFSIPSGSMRPTLLEGDYLFVTKWAYGYSKHSMPFSPDLFEGRIWAEDPKRGDVAVFKFPPNPSLDYIKRVVGLPGDTIQMKAGQLFINGTAVEREKVGQIDDIDITEVDRPVDVYRETLPNGVSYTTLDVSEGTVGDDTREFVVPDGHFFAMGDNRDNSSDSRFNVGFVPMENLVGRANIVFFSIAGGASPIEIWRWPSEVRTDRLFKSASK